MAKKRVYAFDSEQAFQRTQEATRRTLGTPHVGSQRVGSQRVGSQRVGSQRVGSQRRRQVPVITRAPRSTSADTAPWTIAEYDPATGSEVWQATSAAAGSTVPRRMTGCLVTATYIVKIDITSNENIFCINESDGSAFWRDSLTANQSPNAQAQAAIVNPDGRLFLCTRRTMP